MFLGCEDYLILKYRYNKKYQNGIIKRLSNVLTLSFFNYKVVKAIKSMRFHFQ